MKEKEKRRETQAGFVVREHKAYIEERERGEKKEEKMEVEEDSQAVITSTAAILPPIEPAVSVENMGTSLPFSHVVISKTTLPNAVACSDSNDLAFVTDSCVYITPISATIASTKPFNTHTTQTSPQPSTATSGKASQMENPSQNIFWECSNSGFYLDERLLASATGQNVINPYAQKLMDTSSESYSSASWSPPGCSPTSGSGCLLCVCGGPRHRAIVLHAPPMSALGGGWVPLADLTEPIYKFFAPEWDLDPAAYPGPDAPPDALLSLICPDKEKKSGYAWYLNNNKIVEPMSSCTGYSEYARRAACLLPRYSAWSPLISLCGKRVLFVAVASKLTVSVFLYSPDEDARMFSFASIFKHEKTDVNVTSLTFTVSPTNKSEKADDANPLCDIGDIKLAMGFSDGSLILYSVAANPVTLSSPSAHNVKFTFSESLPIGHPCGRHVTSLCAFESVCDDVTSDVTNQKCHYLAFVRARSLCIWDEVSKCVYSVQEAHPELITGLTYSHVKRQLYTSSIDGTVRAWTVSRRKASSQNESINDENVRALGIPYLDGGSYVYCGKGPIMGIDCSASGALLFALTSNRSPMRKTTFEKRLTSVCFGLALPINQLISDLKERIFSRLNDGFGFVDFCAAVFGIHEQSEKYADELCNSLMGSESEGVEVKNLSRLQFAYAICSFMVSSGNELFRERRDTVGKWIAIAQSEFMGNVSRDLLANDKGISLSEREKMALELHSKTKDVLCNECKFDMNEMCFVCGEKVMFDSIRMGVCPKGHAFKRCAVTRLLIKPSASEPMACCSGCGSNSVSLNNGSFKIFKNPMFWSCPFCVSPFTLT